jgi:RHS repeat-associated protein
MAIQGRKYTSSSSYRYGFNGKENDNEIKGDGNSLDFGNRIYDSRTGRWFTSDPMARTMAYASPYNYTLNNPILYVDANGLWPITFYVRSYEHSAVFATPFVSAGDDRTATTSSSASARIHFKMDIETEGNKLKAYDAWSSPTIQYATPTPMNGPLIGIATPKKDANTDGNGNYDFKSSASQPIMSSIPLVGGLTPNIDIKGTMKITENNGIVDIKGQIKGDGFPDAESFVKDSKGNAVMLGTYNHGSMANPLWSLPGDGNSQMIDVNVQIELDKDGNFSKAWSIDKDGKKSPISIVPAEKPAEKPAN